MQNEIRNWFGRSKDKSLEFIGLIDDINVLFRECSRLYSELSRNPLTTHLTEGIAAKLTNPRDLEKKIKENPKAPKSVEPNRVSQYLWNLIDIFVKAKKEALEFEKSKIEALKNLNNSSNETDSTEDNLILPNVPQQNLEVDISNIKDIGFFARLLIEAAAKREKKLQDDRKEYKTKLTDYEAAKQEVEKLLNAYKTVKAQMERKLAVVRLCNGDMPVLIKSANSTMTYAIPFFIKRPNETKHPVGTSNKKSLYDIIRNVEENFYGLTLSGFDSNQSRGGLEIVLNYYGPNIDLPTSTNNSDQRQNNKGVTTIVSGDEIAKFNFTENERIRTALGEDIHISDATLSELIVNMQKKIDSQVNSFVEVSYKTIADVLNMIADSGQANNVSKELIQKIKNAQKNELFLDGMTTHSGKSALEIYKNIMFTTTGSNFDIILMALFSGHLKRFSKFKEAINFWQNGDMVALKKVLAGSPYVNDIKTDESQATAILSQTAVKLLRAHGFEIENNGIFQKSHITTLLDFSIIVGVLQRCEELASVREEVASTQIEVIIEDIKLIVLENTVKIDTLKEIHKKMSANKDAIVNASSQGNYDIWKKRIEEEIAFITNNISDKDINLSPEVQQIVRRLSHQPEQTPGQRPTEQRSAGNNQRQQGRQNQSGNDRFSRLASDENPQRGQRSRREQRNSDDEDLSSLFSNLES